MLRTEDYDKIREELDNCKRPLFFFDDDADGLTSFLLLYRYKREGKGICVKSKPMLDVKFVRKVNEYKPDKVFVLDMALIDQEFLDDVKVPVVWIDHHDPVERDRVRYFNPRKYGEHTPVSYICYKVVEKDLWIGMTGCIADWYMPDFAKDFKEKYPELMDKKIKRPEVALFESKLGLLVHVFEFCLKGKTNDVNRCFRTLTRINEPDEILNKTSPAGRFIWKKFDTINKMFRPMLKDAMEKIKDTKGKLFVYEYEEKKMSFTAILGNHLTYNFPNKVVMIARMKSGEHKISLRSNKLNLKPLLEKALVGVKGYGGGHEHACGACVDSVHFKQFVENLKKQL
ncbi:DHH family phosphoesterase [Candidatus Woesearchaeota archaeon]|nr:DHH family phosphoesterase [Candidatus Woesearchaeota archaeon]